MAIDDSGLSTAEIQKLDRFQIVLGVATSDINLVVEPPKLYSTPSLVPHAAAAAISKYLDVKCETITLSNACTAGLDAIARGAELIRQGKTDVALAGSAEASITLTTLRSLEKGGMLPDNFNDNPQTASCPFSGRRSGGILAEGAAIVILEKLECAIERGARIYAEVLGAGNVIHPNERADGSALYYAMKEAIENSGIHKNDIEYINAHAPSDPILDTVE